MKLIDIKQHIKILNESTKHELRKKYINKFICVADEDYKKDIEKLHMFKDGLCYHGYLWDYLIDPIVIDEKYIDILAEGIQEVYIFWDIHTSERIMIDNYWKFGKDDVLKGNMSMFLNNQEFLPEDIYLFDESMSWTLILTHEYVDGKRYCLKSGEI